MFRCNSCLRSLHLLADPTSTDYVKTFYSQCKHIFCVNCLRQTHPICRVCCRPTRFIAVEKNLRFQLRILFEPTSNIIRRVCNAINFQMVHREYNNNQLMRIYTQYKQHNDSLRQRIEMLYGKCRKHAEQNQKLKCIIKKSLAAR